MGHKGLKFRDRVLLFLMVVIPLLLIRNGFRTGDEYDFAKYLDHCVNTLYSTHAYGAFLSHIIWWVLGSCGVAVSALHALTITSALMSGVGAVALIDLGVFWGLSTRTALLFSLPIILSNAFMRYGTSAYPGPVAVGMGLVSMNLLMRAMDAPSEEGSFSSRKMFWAGFWMGIAALMHTIVLELVPGILVGIAIVAARKISRRSAIMRAVLWYVLGLATILGAGYMVMSVVRHFSPGHVLIQGLYQGTAMMLLVGQWPQWLPGFSDVATELKTFGALFFSGVHSSNRFLEILFNIPRIGAPLLILAAVFFVWRKRKEMPCIKYWVLPFLLSLATQFFVMLFLTFALCRQYALMSFVVLGPLFLILGICVRRVKKSFASIAMGFMAIACAIYMIWGVEGIFWNMNYKGVGFDNKYSSQEFFTPKRGYMPWDAARCTFQF